MATLGEIEREVSQWVKAADLHAANLAALEAQEAKLAPNKGVKFWDIGKHNALREKIRGERAKHESALRELVRLREAAEVERRKADELKRSRATYERLLVPGAIDWTAVEGHVDREAHYAELREKIGRIDAELEAMYAA